MAAIENRSRYTVSVKNRDDLYREFPFTKLIAAKDWRTVCEMWAPIDRLLISEPYSPPALSKNFTLGNLNFLKSLIFIFGT